MRACCQPQSHFRHAFYCCYYTKSLRHVKCQVTSLHRQGSQAIAFSSSSHAFCHSLSPFSRFSSFQLLFSHQHKGRPANMSCRHFLSSERRQNNNNECQLPLMPSRLLTRPASECLCLTRQCQLPLPFFSRLPFFAPPPCRRRHVGRHCRLPNNACRSTKVNSSGKRQVKWQHKSDKLFSHSLSHVKSVPFPPSFSLRPAQRLQASKAGRVRLHS